MCFPICYWDGDRYSVSRYRYNLIIMKILNLLNSITIKHALKDRSESKLIVAISPLIQFSTLQILQKRFLMAILRQEFLSFLFLTVNYFHISESLLLERTLVGETCLSFCIFSFNKTYLLSQK